MKYGKNRGGFSLIELMVVIVITGVLAAVAVPKLFGHMAKAKASEVYSAAGTYIALQDAYNSEHQEVIGSWGEIGYEMPSTSNFKYYEGTKEGGKAIGTSVTVSSGEVAAWKAMNNMPLNYCDAGGIWQIDVVAAPANVSYRLDYQVKITGGANGDCGVLTRNFGTLSTINHVAETL